MGWVSEEEARRLGAVTGSIPAVPTVPTAPAVQAAPAAGNFQNNYTPDAINRAAGRITTEYGTPSVPTFKGTYDEQIRDIYNRIANRGEFAYDVGNDPLYSQYRDKYVKQGQTAMKDAMGQAAALTGGYGSTYSQQVGQQVYNAYLDKLNDVIPELYNAAYGRYQDEGNELYKRYSMLGDLANDEYGKWRDSVSDARYADETAYERQRYADAQSYERQQDAYSTLAALIQATGYNPTTAELEEAGMSQGQAQALIGKYISGILPDDTAGEVSGGGSSGGGSGFVPASSAPSWWNNMSTAERKALQSSLGISADGIWGAQTKAATEAAGYNGAGTGSSSGNAGGYLGSIGYSDLPQPNESRGITRGSTQREAYQAWQNGEITYSEYQSILKALH